MPSEKVVPVGTLNDQTDRTVHQGQIQGSVGQRQGAITRKLHQGKKRSLDGAPAQKLSEGRAQPSPLDLLLLSTHNWKGPAMSNVFELFLCARPNPHDPAQYVHPGKGFFP